MADKIQILIEAILKKTTKQELENELRKIEKNLKPLKVNADTNAEAQIKLYKSLQKIYKEEEKQRLNQEKLAQRALAEKEKLLQYEQKVRMAIEKQKKKEEELNKILQERIVIYKQEAEARLLNLKSRYGDLLNTPEIKQQIDAFRESLDKLNTSNFNVRKLNADFKTLEASVKSASAAVKATHRDVMTLGDMFKVAWNKMLVWAGAGTLLFGTIRQIKKGISYITELDNSLNEIRIVTNKTQQEVNQLGLSYNKLAKEMGVTTKEVVSTAADLFRQGLDDSQVEERMKAIIQYAKISGISLEESNKIITATANATGESVEKIIDVFAMLGDITASGAEEIGEALQKVASTAENSGVSLEKAASWIATISSITRESASSIGNSLKTIISRYEQIKAKGFNEEDATKINDVTKALQAVGITAVDAQGQLRPIAEVLDELGAKWDGLTRNEKAYVATTLAGTHQRNRLITLLNNYNDSLKNYEAALNSAGTAEQKFAIYQDSVQAKLDKFKATLESLYQNTLNSGFLKFVLDLGTGIVSLTDKIGLFNTAISSLIIYFTFFKTKPLFLPLINAATIAITKLTAGLNLSTAAAIKLNTALGMLAPVAVFFAIQGLIKLFDALNVSLEEYKNSVDESYNKAQSNIAQLKQWQKEYEELANKTELTRDEKAKLIEIERELKTRFGETAQAIDLQNGFLETNIDLMRQLTKEEAERFLLLNERAHREAKKLFEEPYYLTFNGGEYIEFKNIEEAIKEMEEAVRDAVDKSNIVYNERKKILEKLYKEHDSAIDIISKYEGYESLLAESVDETSDSLQEYEDILKQLNDILEQSNDTIDSVQSDLKTLNQVLNDVQNGQSLNAETVLKLIQNHKELIPAIHKTADGWTIEKDAIENLRKAKIEEARTAIENQINSTKATLDNVSARVNAYGIEIAAIEDLKSAQQEASKLGFKRVFGETAFEDIKFDDSKNRITVGDKITEWSKEQYERIKQSFNEQKLINDAILKFGELKGRNEKLLELLSDPNFGVSSSTKTKKEYTPSTEQEALKELLEAEKISLEEYYNRLLALEKSQYAEYANKSAAQLEQMLRSHNEEIAKKTEKYLALTTERKQVKTQLDTKAFEINISLLTNALDELKDVYGRLSDTDFDEKLANINQQADIQKRLIEAYNNELARLKKEYQAGNILLSKYSESVAELEKRIKDANRALKDLSISLPDVFRTQLKEYKKQIDKLMDEEEKAHKQRLDNIKKEKEAFIDYIDSQISKLERLRAEEDYASDIAEITEELNKLQQERSKLALAAASGDMEAISKVNELNEKIAEQQKKLAKRQSDEEYRRRKQNLQDIKKTYQAEVDARIDAENAKYEAIKSNYEKLISDMELFADANITLNVSMVEEIINSYNILADSFSGNVREMAKVFSIEFIDKLREAQKEIANLNRAMGGSAKITQPTTTLKHHSVLGEGFEKMSDVEFAQYVANKKKWEEGTVTEAERKYNENLRKKYGIKEDKYSYWDLVGYYKDGGINTQTGIAMLHGTPSKPEFILNTEQMKRLVTNLAFNVAPPKYNIPKTGQKSEIRIDSLITVQGNVTKDTVPAIKNAGLGIVNTLKGLGVVINNG